MGYASLGAWGARNGPRIIRRLLDRERPWTYVALVVVDVVVLAFVTLMCVLLFMTSSDQPLWLRWLVLGSFSLVACGVALWLLEAVSRWWWSRRRPGVPSLATAPSGAPSTAVPRSRAALVTPFAIVALQTLWCMLMVAIVADAPLIAALFGVLTVASGSRLLPFLLGRAAAGGVFLTEGGVELRWGVRTTVVPWDALRGYPIDPTEGLPSGYAVTTEKAFPIDVPTDVTDRVGPGRVAVPVAYLAIGARELGELLAFYAGRPRLRGHLGTRASLDWRPTPPSAVTMTDDGLEP